MRRNLRTSAVAAIAVIPWLPAVAMGGGRASGGKAGSTTSMTAQHSSMRPHHGQSVVRGGACCFGSTHFDDASFLIVDATPAEAQVFLDGRLLGSAADLLARALPLAPGRHTAQIIAPGFKPYRAQFGADPIFSTHLRVTLSHE
jgi:PEGA domain